MTNETLQAQQLDDILVSDFELNHDIISKNDSDKIKGIRKEAIQSFKTLGIPTIKNEAWKFSNIKKILENSGRLSHPFAPPKDLSTPIEEIFSCDITELDTYDLALINGWFPKTLPLMQRLPSGGQVGSLGEAFELFPEITDKYYGQIADYKKDAFTALNTAFATDGVYAYFPKGSEMQKPLQIVNLVTVDEGSLIAPIVQPHNLIVVEENSYVKIVICDHTLSNNKSFSNSVTEVFVGENSHVEIYRVQNQNIYGSKVSMLHVHQKANSKFTSNTITLNGGFIRNNQVVELQEESSEANLFGTFLIDKTQHVDNNTFIDHQVPNCQSNELFKGILDEKAHGVFRGQILVRKDAQQTNSYQKNNNLLLTDTATMNTMPQLEIYADDVKCSHGATVGYLNQEEMFYLMSRGIKPHDARLLLMNAFVGEIINKINIPALRERISYLVNQRLKGELSHCALCVLKCRE